jgi:hypothetical protein
MGVFRFLAPTLPLLVVLADEGLARTLPAATEPRGRAWRAAAVAALAVAVTAGVWGHVAQARVWAGYEKGLQQAHVALGRWLAARATPGARVALGDAGAVPFYSGLPVIDLWGLADVTVARLPGEYGDRPGTADYALGERPTFVVLWNLTPIQGEPGKLRIVGAQPFDREIAEHPAFGRDYRFTREFTFRAEEAPATGYYLDVFERRPAVAPRLE